MIMRIRHVSPERQPGFPSSASRHMHAFRVVGRSLAAAVLVCTAACSGGAVLPVDAGIGPHPTLPEPQQALIPTVNVVDAKGWAADAAPTPEAGLTVTAF